MATSPYHISSLLDKVFRHTRALNESHNMGKQETTAPGVAVTKLGDSCMLLNDV